MEQIDLETIRGDDDGWVFEATYEDGEPVDFTGCRLDLHIKPITKNAPTIKLSTTTGEIEAVGNLITVILPHDKTELAKWTEANWDIQLIDAQELVNTPAGGEFVLNKDVTEIEK